MIIFHFCFLFNTHTKVMFYVCVGCGNHWEMKKRMFTVLIYLTHCPLFIVSCTRCCFSWSGIVCMGLGRMSPTSVTRFWYVPEQTVLREPNTSWSELGSRLKLQVYLRYRLAWESKLYLARVKLVKFSADKFKYN